MNRQNSMVKIISLLMAITVFLSILSSCGKSNDSNENSNAVSDNSAKAENALQINPSEPVPTDVGETKALENNSGKTDATTANAVKAKTTVPVSNSAPKSPSKSGLNNKPSTVENATGTKDLARVDPAQAANYSYDTEVSVSKMQSQSINTAEFTRISYDQFANHIHSVWRNFQIQDKVIIEAKYMNEYLNYVCLPLKESFYEINCNGYDVSYVYDNTGQYIYMDIKWSYYITEAQYNACRARASEICRSLSGSTADKIKAVHDRIAVENEYVLNVDGAYNCLINHKSDCDGYTAAFQICMDILGVPCKAYATSSHIFNCVQLDGKWYVVDVTYDDQTPAGFIYTRYFLAGYEMYVNYPILKDMLSPSDYPYSKKLLITDDTKFRTYLQLGASVSYKLDDNGRVILNDGSYYVFN